MKHRIDPIRCICKICKSKFLNYYTKRKTCSSTCLKKCKSLNVSGDKNPSKRPEVSKKISLTVLQKYKQGYKNPLYKKKRPDVSKYNKKFKPLQILDKNPNWRGGLSFGKYGVEFNKELKKKIRERDGYKCQVCFITNEDCLKQFGKSLDVHHIDYNKKNNTKANLVSLCIECHAKTNFNRNKWHKFFEDIKLKNLEKKYGHISILIGTKDRPTEIGLLLQSLRTSTYQLYDIYILDDAGGTPITNYYFVNHLITRLRLENHRVLLKRNDFSNGVSKMRQQMVDWVIKDAPQNQCLLRIDDDTLVEPLFIQKLIETLEQGYDIASGLTPPMHQPEHIRETKFVKPVISPIKVDKDYNIKEIGDEQGYCYSEEDIIPSHHFRSTALIKREVHEKVKYPDNFSFSGWREEEVFSFRAVCEGFKIGVHIGAIHYHLLTPSGGHRPTTTQDNIKINDMQLQKEVHKLFKEHGRFLK